MVTDNPRTDILMSDAALIPKDQAGSTGNAPALPHGLWGDGWDEYLAARPWSAG